MADLDVDTALDVLAQLDDQLGDVDPDARAIVGLRRDETGAVALVDVDLQDNGVLEVADDVDGLAVVTGEDVAHGDVVVPLNQLVCVLRSGAEVGVYRAGDRAELRHWRTDDDPEDEAAALRPRDLTANTARRALGLPSLVEWPPITDVLTRAWLLSIAGEALTRFDGPDGPREVTGEQLRELAEAAPASGLGSDDAEVPPSYEQIHAAAVSGELELGPFTVDQAHAAWLDPAGLAQVLDRTLPTTDELLGSLEMVGDDELLAWALGWLAARDWHHPG